MYSVIHTLKNFLYRPLFGIGIATTYCHGATALSIAEIGVFGVFSYIRCYFRRLVKNTDQKVLCRNTILLWLAVNLLATGSATRLIVQLDGVLIVICMICLAKKGRLLYEKCEKET